MDDNYSILFKLVKKDNNNDLINNNMYELYKSVFFNLVIKNHILNYVKGIFFGQRYCFATRKEFLEINQDFRQYIQILTINGKNEKITKELIKEYPIPETITQLEFTGDFNNELLPGYIPNHIKVLRFYKFNKVLKVGDIPFGVLDLNFSFNYAPKIYYKSQPPVNHSLTFELVVDDSNDFNQKLSSGLLPQSITKLKLGDYNHEIKKGDLPFVNLTDLTLLNYKDHKLTNESIPSCVRSLTLGSYNHELIPGDLPITLSYLNLGTLFNRNLVIGSLPHGLKTIYFSDDYNQPLSNGLIPSTVTTLHLGILFNYEILPGHLPNSLTSLTFSKNYQRPLSVGSIPNGVTFLEFGFYFSQSVSNGILPSNLETLIFGKSFERVIRPTDIPNSLRSITFDNFYKKFRIDNMSSEIPSFVNVIFKSQDQVIDWERNIEI